MLLLCLGRRAAPRTAHTSHNSDPPAGAVWHWLRVITWLSHWTMWCRCTDVSAASALERNSLWTGNEVTLLTDFYQATFCSSRYCRICMSICKAVLTLSFLIFFFYENKEIGQERHHSDETALWNSSCKNHSLVLLTDFKVLCPISELHQ